MAIWRSLFLHVHGLRVLEGEKDSLTAVSAVEAAPALKYIILLSEPSIMSYSSLVTIGYCTGDEQRYVLDDMQRIISEAKAQATQSTYL
jgi:hypothetical protein